MQSGLQEECWRIAERWCTLISVKQALSSNWRRGRETGQRAEIELKAPSPIGAQGPVQTGQRVLLGCWAWVSVHRLLTSISTENQIGPDGSESFAGVLALCSALAHLNLGMQDGRLGPCTFALNYSE
jgi:hypothetical protein